MPLKGRASVLNAVDSLVESKNNQLRAIYIKGLQNIALGTPVDEGRARNSWFLGVGRIKSGVFFGFGRRRANKSGSSSISQVGRIPKNILNKRLFFTNNMPYINKLEYGGFPSPSGGSWDKRSQSFDVKTIGGFSDQAPSGWVRIEILRMRKRIRAIK